MILSAKKKQKNSENRQRETLAANRTWRLLFVSSDDPSFLSPKSQRSGLGFSACTTC